MRTTSPMHTYSPARERACTLLPTSGSGRYSNGKVTVASVSLYAILMIKIARPEQAAAQSPQPTHRSKSILGVFVIGFPT